MSDQGKIGQGKKRNGTLVRHKRFEEVMQKAYEAGYRAAVMQREGKRSLFFGEWYAIFNGTARTEEDMTYCEETGVVISTAPMEGPPSLHTGDNCRCYGIEDKEPTCPEPRAGMTAAMKSSTPTKTA